MENLVTSSALKQVIAFAELIESAIYALLQVKKLEQRLESLAKAIRLQWPILNFTIIDSYKRMKKDEHKAWRQLNSKGSDVNDSKGNAWLYNTKLLKPSRFLTAMRLRRNMTSDEVTKNKVVAQSNVKFRNCRTWNATLVTCWVSVFIRKPSGTEDMTRSEALCLRRRHP